MNKSTAQLLLLIIFLLVGAGAFWFVGWRDQNTADTVTDTSDMWDVVTDERVTVLYPKPGDTITSPLVVRGEARGPWYFEATFPIVVVNWDGLIIGEGYAEARGDPKDGSADGASWMTEDFVPFKGTITFTSDTTVSDRGAVIFHRSNASGLPEHDAAVEIPIVFE